MARLVYKLVGQKRSDTSQLGYYAKGDIDNRMEPLAPLAYSRTLPRFHRIMEFNSKTDRYEPKRVAYAPNEKSIYVDEWVNPESKAVKPRFKEGILVVDLKEQRALADLLDVLDINGSKPNRDEKAPVKYIQLNKDKQAEGQLTKSEKTVKEMLVFFELPEGKLRAIANSVGINTNATDSVWKWRLFDWAQNNLEDFVKETKNPDLDYVDTISRAEKMGIINFRENTWFHKDIQILKVSTMKNPYTELAERLVNDPALERSIANQVSEKEGGSSRKFSKEELNFDEMDNNALLALSKKVKVVKYKIGVGHEILRTGRSFGDRSVESAVEALDADMALRDLLIKEISEQAV